MDQLVRYAGFGVLAPLIGYHLRRAHGAFVVDFGAALSGTGMRQILVGILAVIANQPGINQGAVGRILDIKRANMVSLINELVDAQLVCRLVDPQDRRAFSLNLTEKGAEMLQICLERISAHEQRMLEGFTDLELAQLRDLLGRIARPVPVED
ncbi:MarR family winged helix-turn-helix transcriptional regulator [Sphingopyxis yananensis]|uniref:MarR family winged helix-turn-helix transcriptional regulator n=1 Tax=Sphingopyxis yananensis TaxID=2886687 RepID=UPI001D1227B2|nr:MarR family transcriptional regulator [Sphingopyxis yananensis]MCC2603508.1 MarR family transcriptional regulator [Sphingopyxis yananensis]